MWDPFTLTFVQRGIVEVLLLALGAGLVGTWVVLRGLSFFSHAVGTAAFPGLVLADGLGFSAQLGALGTAGVVAVAVGLLARHDRDRDRYDSITALVLVGALVAGVILASDVFHSGSNIETLLFGSLLVVDGGDQLWAAGAAVAVVLATAVLGPRWLATGFDPASARGLGLRPGVTDAILIGLVAFAAIASLSAIGALLATALIVVPAATTRLLFDRLLPWQIATVALAAVEGVAGLWASVQLNAPPGATIAVLTGAAFALAAVARELRKRPALAATGAAAAALLVAAGCGGGDDGVADAPGGTPRITVVATTTQLGDIVRAIGGAGVSVTQILKPNSDPHDYEPRPRDVGDTAAAKLIVASGGHLDHWIEDVERQAGSDAPVLAVEDRLGDPLPGEERGEPDPHWWHDPRNVELAIPLIRDALAKANPRAQRAYSAGAERYLAQVRKLDAGIASCMRSVPAAERKLVTDHDAFGYFARRYGIAVVGAVIPSQTTGAQASAGALAELRKVILREGVKAVFPETSVNQKLAKAIARETGASADHELYGDALGPAGSSGDTYLHMELHNADAMLRGFTGGKAGCAIPGL